MASTSNISLNLSFNFESDVVTLFDTTTYVESTVQILFKISVDGDVVAYSPGWASGTYPTAVATSGNIEVAQFAIPTDSEGELLSGEWKIEYKVLENGVEASVSKVNTVFNPTPTLELSVTSDILVAELYVEDKTVYSVSSQGATAVLSDLDREITITYPTSTGISSIVSTEELVTVTDLWTGYWGMQLVSTIQYLTEGPFDVKYTKEMSLTDISYYMPYLVSETELVGYLIQLLERYYVVKDVDYKERELLENKITLLLYNYHIYLDSIKNGIDFQPYLANISTILNEELGYVEPTNSILITPTYFTNGGGKVFVDSTDEILKYLEDAIVDDGETITISSSAVAGFGNVLKVAVYDMKLPHGFPTIELTSSDGKSSSFGPGDLMTNVLQALASKSTSVVERGELQGFILPGDAEPDISASSEGDYWIGQTSGNYWDAFIVPSGYIAYFIFKGDASIDPYWEKDLVDASRGGSFLGEVTKTTTEPVDANINDWYVVSTYGAVQSYTFDNFETVSNNGSEVAVSTPIVVDLITETPCFLVKQDAGWVLKKSHKYQEVFDTTAERDVLDAKYRQAAMTVSVINGGGSEIQNLTYIGDGLTDEEWELPANWVGFSMEQTTRLQALVYEAVTASLTREPTTFEKGVSTSVQWEWAIAAHDDTIVSSLFDGGSVALTGNDSFTITTTTTKTLAVTVVDTTNNITINTTSTAITPQWSGQVAESLLDYSYANTETYLHKVISSSVEQTVVVTTPVAGEGVVFLSTKSGATIVDANGFPITLFDQTTITQTLSDGSTVTLYQYSLSVDATVGTYKLT